MSYDLTIHTQKSSAVPTLDYVRSVHDGLRRSLNISGAWFELATDEPRGADAKWFLENDSRGPGEQIRPGLLLITRSAVSEGVKSTHARERTWLIRQRYGC